MTDMVQHPAHYGGEDDPYEVIKVAEAWGFDSDAYLFNVLKYIRRDKGDTIEDRIEDLKKARFYLDRKIRRLEELFDDEPVMEDKTRIPVRSRYIEVRVDPKNHLKRYAVHAHPDWTVGIMAAIVATGAEVDTSDCGTFGISLSPDSALVNGRETVSWLLRNYPPEKHSYFLRTV